MMPTVLVTSDLLNQMADEMFRDVYGDVSAVQDIQEHLASEMERTGVTRSELARRLGVSPAAVARFFRSENPGLVTLRRYGRALGIAVNVCPVEARSTVVFDSLVTS